MNKIVIFGAGQIGQRLAIKLGISPGAGDIIFTDNNSKLWDTDIILNNISYPVVPPTKLCGLNYDKVHITVKDARDAILTQLISELNVPANLIDCSFLDSFVNNVAQEHLRARENFIKNFAEMIYAHEIKGSVAEVGVYKGAFASVINACFPDRKIYLYDTFEGFDERDIDAEIAFSGETDTVHEWRDLLGNFANTSAEYVVAALPNPDNAIVKKGYFPDTFCEESESFCFVNLDCDLYNPIKAGLERFYPCMSRKGVILVHEYFDDISFLPGIRKAVDDFVANTKDCITLPVGDSQSIAIIKP